MIFCGFHNILIFFEIFGCLAYGGDMVSMSDMMIGLMIVVMIVMMIVIVIFVMIINV